MAKTKKKTKKASSKGSAVPSGASPTMPLGVKKTVTKKTGETTPQIKKIMREMKITAKRVNYWLKLALIVLLGIFVLGLIMLLCRQWVIGSILSGTPLLLFSYSLIGNNGRTGLMIIQPEDRAVVEFLGKTYCIKKPGLKWICPHLMSVRAIIYTWKQPVKLFPDRTFPNGVHIDFKNGGKAELVEPILWVQLFGAGTAKEDENILKAVYSVPNWKQAIQESGEDALRTCLNNLTVDETLSATHRSQRKSWWDAVENNFPELGFTIGRYGFKVKGLTISDFNWDEEVVKLRQDVLKEERSQKIAELSLTAAKKEVEQKALELGGLCLQIAETFEAKGHSPEVAINKASELVLYKLGVENNSIVDVRAESGGDGGDLLSLIVAAANSVRGNKQSKG